MSNDRPKHLCSVCQVTGKNGANFVLVVGNDEQRVHKYCGEQAVSAAPEGVVARVVRWDVLRAEKHKAREDAERVRVSAFWAEKFAQAKPSRKVQPQQAAAAD